MSAAVAQHVAPMFLVPIAGPQVETLTLDSGARTSWRIGRNEQCELPLPPREDRVSRFHARFDFDGKRWHLTDLGSRWGTYVNGQRLAPDAALPLGEGDLVRVSPWTFLFGSQPNRPDTVLAADDTSTVGVGGGLTTVRTVGDARLVDEQLGVLLESTAAIHGAADETRLAELLIDAALRGTGMANAAVLRPVDSSGRVQIVASRFTSPGGPGGEGPRFSRSLLAAAANGQVAELSGSGSAGMGNIAESIVVMNIASALCVPIILGAARVETTPAAPPGTGGGTVALYLYLDSRGHAAPRPRPNAAPFCVALGRMTGLALANLKRIEIERRQASIEADLNAAVAAQQWILPERTRQVGPVCYTGESRPGRFVGGDFFDVIDLGDGRVAVSLGDVCGKGMGACVLMTATQGFLHASLREHGDVQRALNAVNRYVSSRTPDERFVTAWVAVMDLGAGTLTYIDAGHGYALLRSDIQPVAVGNAPPIDMDATTPIPSIPVELRAGDGLPIGVEPAFNYRAATVALPASGRLLVVSDGVIEQTGIVQSPQGGLSQEEFGLGRLKAALAGAARDGDTVADLFAAVVNHAGTTQLADDATAVLVRW